MNNLNSILVEGNLVKDAELQDRISGKPICKMTLASSRYYRKHSSETFEKEVSFFEIEAEGKLAEACYAKGKKGQGVRVVGRIRQDRWTDSDGKTCSSVVIVAEHVEFRHFFAAETNTEYEDFAEESSETIEEEALTIARS
jgi:single-strand DNA-binding protein